MTKRNDSRWPNRGKVCSFTNRRGRECGPVTETVTVPRKVNGALQNVEFVACEYHANIQRMGGSLTKEARAYRRKVRIERAKSDAQQAEANELNQDEERAVWSQP